MTLLFVLFIAEGNCDCWTMGGIVGYIYGGEELMLLSAIAVIVLSFWDNIMTALL